MDYTVMVNKVAQPCQLSDPDDETCKFGYTILDDESETVKFLCGFEDKESAFSDARHIIKTELNA